MAKDRHPSLMFLPKSDYVQEGFFTGAKDGGIIGLANGGNPAQAQAEQQLRQEWGRDFEGKVKQAGALAKANINSEVLDMQLQDGTRIGDHPEIIKGFAKIADMMSEDKIVATESENVNTVADIESEISTIINDTNGPYWNKGHPDHDKMVQQVYTLREMLNAK